MKPNDMNLYDLFIREGGMHNLSNFLKSLDLLVRTYSQGSLETLENNREGFSKAVTELVMEAVVAMIDIDTADPESPFQGQAGLFPKYEGEPSLTHFFWQFKESEDKASDLGHLVPETEVD